MIIFTNLSQKCSHFFSCNANLVILMLEIPDISSSTGLCLCRKVTIHVKLLVFLHWTHHKRSKIVAHRKLFPYTVLQVWCKSDPYQTDQHKSKLISLRFAESHSLNLQKFSIRSFSGHFMMPKFCQERSFFQSDQSLGNSPVLFIVFSSCRLPCNMHSRVLDSSKYNGSKLTTAYCTFLWQLPRNFLNHFL